MLPRYTQGFLPGNREVELVAERVETDPGLAGKPGQRIAVHAVDPGGAELDRGAVQVGLANATADPVGSFEEHRLQTLTREFTGTGKPGSTGSNHRDPGPWRKLPGRARDIGIGADGSVWAIGMDDRAGGHGIYRFNGSDWDKVPGSGTQISVGPDGEPWVVNRSGDLYRSFGTYY